MRVVPRITVDLSVPEYVTVFRDVFIWRNGGVPVRKPSSEYLLRNIEGLSLFTVNNDR